MKHSEARAQTGFPDSIDQRGHSLLIFLWSPMRRFNCLRMINREPSCKQPPRAFEMLDFWIACGRVSFAQRLAVVVLESWYWDFYCLVLTLERNGSIFGNSPSFRATSFSMLIWFLWKVFCWLVWSFSWIDWHGFLQTADQARTSSLLSGITSLDNSFQKRVGFCYALLVGFLGHPFIPAWTAY